MFKLHYWVKNGGDGSVGVEFAESEKAAHKAEKDDNDEYGECWGEPSVGDVTLDIQNGCIVRQEQVWDGKQHSIVWKPLEKVKEKVKTKKDK